MHISRNILNYTNFIFILLFFPSFVSGVFFPNLIFTLLIVVNLVLNFNNIKNYFNDIKLLNYFFFSFYFLLLLSSLLSDFIIFSLESSLLYFSYIIFVYILIFIFFENRKYDKYFLYFGLATFLFLSIDAFYEIFNGSNLLNYSAMKGRIAGMFGDRWVLGSYLVRLLPVLVGIFFINYNNFEKNFKYFAYIVFFLSSVIIIYSGERKAFLLFLLYFSLIFAYIFNKITFSKKILFISGLIILFSSPFFVDDYKKRIQQKVFHHLTNNNIDENHYLSMYKSSYKMFVDNPLFGVGPNNFRKVCQLPEYNLSKLSCNTHPHNIPLQLLSETGITGFLLVYFVFFYFLHKLYALSKKKFDTINLGIYSIICSIIINLWPIIPSGNFFLSWYGILFYLPLALYLMYLKKIKLFI